MCARPRTGGPGPAALSVRLDIAWAARCGHRVQAVVTGALVRVLTVL